MGPVYDENRENILTSRRPQLRKKKKTNIAKEWIHLRK